MLMQYSVVLNKSKWARIALNKIHKNLKKFFRNHINTIKNRKLKLPDVFCDNFLGAGKSITFLIT